MEADEKAVLFGDDEDQKITKEDEEEDKVEKFFELIRNLREARNRLIIRPEMAETTSVNDRHVLVSSEESQKMKKNKRKRMEVRDWVPSFEKEDFTADLEFRGTPSIFPVPCNATPNKRHVEDGNLNLDLSL